MAEKIEVVIKIPEYYLTHPQDYSCLAECVRRGVSLPKGHGDLIDRQELLKSTLCKTFGLRSVDIENAPTIVEADKEVQNDETDM